MPTLHDSSNPQNKTKKFTLSASVRYKLKAVEELANTDQNLTAVEAKLINRVSTFQKQIDRREEIKEEMYHNIFLSFYWIAKEELPNCKFFLLIELLRLMRLPDILYYDHKFCETDVSYPQRNNQRTCSSENKKS